MVFANVRAIFDKREEALSDLLTSVFFNFNILAGMVLLALTERFLVASLEKNILKDSLSTVLWVNSGLGLGAMIIFLIFFRVMW